MSAIDLNGKFWEITELHKEIGVSYGTVYNELQNYKYCLIYVGRSYLIPDNIAQVIIDKYRNVKRNSIPVTSLVKRFGCQLSTINKIVKLGLPTVSYGDKLRVPSDVCDILEKLVREYKEIYAGDLPTPLIPELMEKFKKEYNKGK